MAPVISPADTGEAVGIAAACGMATDAAPSVAPGAGLLNDCRPIGVGEVIEGVAGAGIAGLALSFAGGWAEGAGSLELSIAGSGGAVPLSSSVIAILKVPSTMTTTLAPTSSERILEVMVDGLLGLVAGGGLERAASGGLVGRRCGRGGLRGAARGGNETGRADMLARAAAGISLIALSEAAMRSDGVATRPLGRVPGSSG